MVRIRYTYSSMIDPHSILLSSTLLTQSQTHNRPVTRLQEQDHEHESSCIYKNDQLTIWAIVPLIFISVLYGVLAEASGIFFFSFLSSGFWVKDEAAVSVEKFITPRAMNLGKSASHHLFSQI